MIGNRLKMLREKKGVYQKDVADYLGVTTSAYGFYEQEQRKVDHETLNRLAEYFNVSTDYLLGRTDDPSPRPKPETNTATKLAKDIEGLPPRDRKAIEAMLDVFKGQDDDVATEEDVGLEVMAAHRTDNPMDDLPEAALKNIARLKRKYLREMSKKK